MRPKTILAVLLMIVTVASVACSRNYPVKGQVVDAKTGQPVEGAVVAVRWVHYYLTPMGTARDEYGTTEVITDAQGQFTVPKYPFASYLMGAYKKGYICWSSEDIFKAEGDPAAYGSYGRFWHRVKEGMIVEIAPIKGPNFPALEHARFVSKVRTQLESSLFSNATISELEMELNANP
jgi:hypothetical protein